METEAGPSKKRKVEGKRKGKAKVRTSVSEVTESVVVDVLQDILKELKSLCAEVGDLYVFAQHITFVAESDWRIQRQTSMCVNELYCYFMPKDDDEESSRVGVENMGSGGNRAKNNGTCDVEMGESGVDIADNDMDETLHQ